MSMMPWWYIPNISCFDNIHQDLYRKILIFCILIKKNRKKICIREPDSVRWYHFLDIFKRFVLEDGILFILPVYGALMVLDEAV